MYNALSRSLSFGSLDFLANSRKISRSSSNIPTHPNKEKEWYVINLTLGIFTCKTFKVCYNSNTNTIDSCNLVRNLQSQVYLYSSSLNSFSSNTLSISGSQYGFKFSDTTSYNNDIGTSNTVNGVPVQWYTNQAGTSTSRIQLSTIDVHLENITNIAQIMLYKCSYLDLTDSTGSNGTEYGIYMYSSSNIRLTSNEARSNSYAGICLLSSVSNIVRYNTVSNNMYGIYVSQSSSNNIIEFNNATFNYYGIYIVDTLSVSNTIQMTNTSGDSFISVQDPSYSGGYPNTGNNRICDAGLDKMALIDYPIQFKDNIGVSDNTATPVTSQSFDFGDGSPIDYQYNASAFHPNHTYVVLGIYLVTYSIAISGVNYTDYLYVNVTQGLPTSPQNLKAAGGNYMISLTWSAPVSDGGFAITNYRIYRGYSSGSETYLTQTGNVLYYTDYSVTNGQIYYYTVSAKNSKGEGPNSSEVSAIPGTVPSYPWNIQATGGNAVVSLTWSAPTSTGGSPITNYRIYRGNSSGTEKFYAQTGNVLTYTDTGVLNGRTYYYNLTACNAIGEGPTSSEVSATPMLAAGLVAYWKFDEGAGNWTYDSSGNGYDGTIVAPSWTSGLSGTALSYDGTSAYVNVPTVPNVVLGSMTKFVMLWINPTLRSNAMFYMGPSGGGSTGNSFRFVTNNLGDLGLDVSGSSAYSSLSLTLNKWNFVFAYYSSYMYYVGIVNATGLQEQYLSLSSQNLMQGFTRIGQDEPNGVYATGVMDEVSLYDRVLTNVEINAAYAQFGKKLSVSALATPPTVASGGSSTITVSVTDLSGAVKGININLTSDNGGYFYPLNGTTDATGVFTSTFVAPTASGTVVCTITATANLTGYLGGTGTAIVTVNYKALVKYTMSGHVYEFATTFGIANATIITGNSYTTTDSNGYYSLSLYNGTYDIHASANNYQPFSVTVKVSGANVQQDIFLVSQSHNEGGGGSNSTFETTIIMVSVIIIIIIVIIIALVLIARRKKPQQVVSVPQTKPVVVQKFTPVQPKGPEIMPQKKALEQKPNAPTIIVTPAPPIVQNAPPSPAKPPVDDTQAKLKHLEEMKKSGLISEEEHAKKAQEVSQANQMKVMEEEKQKKLKQLKDAKDMGLINEEEYKKKASQL